MLRMKPFQTGITYQCCSFWLSIPRRSFDEWGLIRFWEKLGYEEGRSPLDAGRSMKERRLIDTRAVVDSVDAQERKKLFSEKGEFIFILVYGIHLMLANYLWSFLHTVNNIFNRRKFRVAPDLLQTSLPTPTSNQVGVMA